MIRVHLLILLLLATTGLRAAESPVTFYVQYLRANDHDQPDSAGWKEAGPKLSRMLSPTLRWGHYWEVMRKGVNVPPLTVTRVTLGPEREVRIRLVGDTQAEVQLFWKGELRRRIVRDLEAEPNVLTGETGDQEGWFVVIRRSRPTLD